MIAAATKEYNNGKMEDFQIINAHYCDRCNTRKPDGMESLLWFASRVHPDVDVCPACQTEFERKMVKDKVETALAEFKGAIERYQGERKEAEIRLCWAQRKYEDAKAFVEGLTNA